MHMETLLRSASHKYKEKRP